MNRVVYPNAKINLGLKVLNKREDGFHNLETVFFPIFSLTDILEIADSYNLKGESLEGVHTIEKVMFKQTGINAGDFSKNLCVKAYQVLDDYLKGILPPVYMHLIKQIPIGAGLGGGSADASFTLMALNSMFNCGLSIVKLKELSLLLGSDCPFFIDNTPMLGTGRGEILTPFNFSLPDNYRLELIFPPVFVSTSDAYKGIVPRDKMETTFKDAAPLTSILQNPVEAWKTLVFNDFEKTVFAKYPQLEHYKNSLYKKGAVYASMSGSGSAMFGIFKDN